jgi:hypothetical protein
MRASTLNRPAATASPTPQNSVPFDRLLRSVSTSWTCPDKVIDRQRPAMAPERMRGRGDRHHLHFHQTLANDAARYIGHSRQHAPHLLLQGHPSIRTYIFRKAIAFLRSLELTRRLENFCGLTPGAEEPEPAADVLGVAARCPVRPILRAGQVARDLTPDHR